MSTVVKIDDANFEREVLRSPGAVLLDFSATWCGPCKQQVPILEELAREFAGRLKVGAVDVEDAPNTAIRFGVATVPTLILLKDGEVKDQKTGLTSKAKLAGWIEKVV